MHFFFNWIEAFFYFIFEREVVQKRIIPIKLNGPIDRHSSTYNLKPQCILICLTHFNCLHCKLKNNWTIDKLVQSMQ